MRRVMFMSAMALAVATPALAQAVPGDMSTASTPATMTPEGKLTADASKPFGIEPYFGILGGYHSFDRKPGLTGAAGERSDGAQIEGVIGADLPLGPLFIGVEGHGAKGFGDINW